MNKVIMAAAAFAVMTTGAMAQSNRIFNNPNNSNDPWNGRHVTQPDPTARNDHRRNIGAEIQARHQAQQQRFNRLLGECRGSVSSHRRGVIKQFARPGAQGYGHESLSQGQYNMIVDNCNR